MGMNDLVALRLLNLLKMAGLGVEPSTQLHLESLRVVPSPGEAVGDSADSMITLISCKGDFLCTLGGGS